MAFFKKPLCLQMLAFTQHAYMLLAAKAMPFWTSLLTSSERSASRIEPLAPENSPIPLECVVVLMDLAGKLTIHIGHIAPAVPAWGMHGLAMCNCIPLFYLWGQPAGLC